MDKLFIIQTFLGLILLGIIIVITPPSILVSAMDVTKSYVLSTSKVDKSSFYWVVTLVGGSIGLTLVYVSWKKYKAEVRKKVKKDTNS